MRKFWVSNPLNLLPWGIIQEPKKGIMSLLNNSKNSKDKKKNAQLAAAKPGFQSGGAKGKANTKSQSRQSKLTGGAQRGS